jgi:adenylyltransferase/sulfurtransferase
LYLAAAGVGTIGIVDDDEVSLSNLQRQIAHRTSDVGRSKTQSAREAALAINPRISVEEHPERLTATNASELIGAYDIVADGSDNFVTRFLINDACFFQKRTLVSAAVTEFDGQLATFRPGQADCPCYRCLFPEPPPAGSAPSCSETGVLGAAAGVMGTLQALEVVKEITGAGESLAGKLLIYDALSTRFRTVTVKRDPACALCGEHPTIHALA